MTLIASCRCGPRPRYRPPFTADAAARQRRLDPTGTLDLRNKFRDDMDRRWMKLRRVSIAFIDKNSALGLEQKPPHAIAAVTLMPGGDSVKAFQSWMDEALRQILLADGGAWMTPYLSEAASRAALRADRLSGKITVIDRKRLQTLLTLAVVELQGVMEAVSQQAVRAFANGTLLRKRAGEVARDVVMVERSIGTIRGRMVVSHMIVRTFTAVTLDAFRSAGVTRVGSIPERVRRVRIVTGEHGKTITRDAKKDKEKEPTPPPSAAKIASIFRREQEVQALGEVDVITAGDDDVCPECEEISLSGPYDIDEAESLIPAHPNCRCAFIPTADERFAEVE